MQEKLYPVSPEWARRAHIDGPKYEAMYAASVQDPEGFWYEEGGRIDWFRPFTKVKNTSFGGPGTSGEVFIRWFEDGVTNVAYNCIDRHLERRGDQVAIIWEGDDPSELAQDHLPRAAPRGVPDGKRPAQPRRRPRRYGHDLPADDPRGRLRDARLRASRRDPLGRVRRLLAGLAREPDRGLRSRRW